MNKIKFFIVYPFLTNGKERPFFENGRQKKDYFDNLNGVEYETDTPFFETQQKIIVDFDSAITYANYIRVLTNYDEGAESWDDEFYFFVKGKSVLQDEELKPYAIDFSVSMDFVNTKFFQSAGVNDLRLPIMRLVHLVGYSDTDDLIASGCRFSPIYDYNYAPKTNNLGFEYSKTLKNQDLFSWIVSFIDSNGDIFQRVIHKNGASAETIRGESFRVGSIAKISDSTGESVENISLLHCYILPNAFLDKNVLLNEVDIFITTDGIRINCAAINSEKISGYGIKQNYEISTGFVNPPFYKRFFKTAKRLEEITDTTQRNIPIFTSISDNGQEKIEIMIFLNGNWVNIADDFEFSISVNTARLQISQDRVSSVLGDIANVIGSVGGVVGGVASGNYFGAVQSLTSGVGAISNKYDRLDNPATIKTSGGVLNAILQYGGATIMILNNPINAKMVNDSVDIYGYKCNLFKKNLNIKKEMFYKCDYVDFLNVDEETDIELKNIFYQGVRFVGI